MDKVVIENATLIFKNFSGKEKTYNKSGDRNFCIVLEDEQAKEMIDAGWNVKILSPREEGDTSKYYLQVKVNYAFNPPNIYKIERKKKTALDEHTVCELDNKFIASADVVISPYEWEVNGKKGIAAYLRTLYANIGEHQNGIEILNAQILFRNFSGEEKVFNKKGERNFCVIINEDVVPDMIADGWNVKILSPRDEGDEPRHYIQVKVSYQNVPPEVYICTDGQNETLLDEDSIGILDFADIKKIDLIISPYSWETNGKKGIKGYLQSAHVEIYDDFYAKYNYNE